MNKQTKGHSIAKINAQAGVLELSITGVIYYGWTASDFRYEVDKALKQGITTATVYLNTLGGSVYEASEIVNQLKRMSSVTITAGALVASAGTYIMAHFPAKAYKSSQFMIHKPMTSFEGNIDQLKAEEKHLENLTSQYREVYASRFGKTTEEIDQLWQQDYWLNATEAQELGLITEITDGEPEITTETIAMMMSSLKPGGHLIIRDWANPNKANELFTLQPVSKQAKDEMNIWIRELKKNSIIEGVNELEDCALVTNVKNAYEILFHTVWGLKSLSRESQEQYNVTKSIHQWIYSPWGHILHEPNIHLERDDSYLPHLQQYFKLDSVPFDTKMICIFQKKK